MTFSHLAQLGSINRLFPSTCTRNEAWPIQVTPTSLEFNSGKMGEFRSPAHLAKSEGMRTSAKKFRRCQPVPGFKPTFRATCATTVSLGAVADFLISAFRFRGENKLGTKWDCS